MTTNTKPVTAMFRKDEATVKPFKTNSSSRKPALGYINQDLIDANGGTHKLRGMPMYGDTYVEKQILKAAEAYYAAQNELVIANPDHIIAPFEVTTKVTIQLVMTDEARGDISF